LVELAEDLLAAAAELVPQKGFTSSRVRHPVEGVEGPAARRGDSGDCAAADDTVREECGTREGMRASSGEPSDGEPVPPQLVREQLGVGGNICDGSSWPAARTVTRPAVQEHPQTAVLD
jgi:hypothetical protein